MLKLSLANHPWSWSWILKLIFAANACFHFCTEWFFCCLNEKLESFIENFLRWFLGSGKCGGVGKFGVGRIDAQKIVDNEWAGDAFADFEINRKRFNFVHGGNEGHRLGSPIASRSVDAGLWLRLRAKKSISGCHDLSHDRRSQTEILLGP